MARAYAKIAPPISNVQVNTADRDDAAQTAAILSKLDVESRAAAVAVALRQNLV